MKAPKQLSPMVPINQSELPAITGLAGTADGKQTGAEAAIGQAPTVGAAVVGKQGVADIATGKEQQHYQRNGYGSHAADSGEVDGQTETANHDGMVDGDKTTFQPTGEAAATVVPAKKTSLVLKITTKNGKQVVAKVIKSSTSRKGQRDSADGRAATDGEGAHPDDGDEEEDDDDDDEEDQEEVVVNIESSKPSGEEATVAAPVAKKDDQLNAAETKKVDVVPNGGTEGSKERNSSSSKDKDRHNHSHHRDREREKDRKGSSRSSSSKTSSSSSSSSSKHKSSSSSSSKSSSSSSSRSKDKDRHGSSSSSSGSKHKSSSSSSSSKSGSSSSKSSSSSDKHRDKDKSSSGGSRDGKESKAQSASPKLARARSRDDSVGGSNI